MVVWPRRAGMWICWRGVGRMRRSGPISIPLRRWPPPDSPHGTWAFAIRFEELARLPIPIMRKGFQDTAAMLSFAVVLTGCTPNDPETAVSPVQAVTRTTERLQQSNDVYTRRGDDGVLIAKVQEPAPKVWDALKGALTDRKVNLTVFGRSGGRMGDTAMVFMRRWSGQTASYYFDCGQSMTGRRADEDRLRAVLLAQLTRLREDTIAVAVHFSAFASPITMGASAARAQC